jgi:TolB-like protein/Tfp pilus assembly protein PilF
MKQCPECKRSYNDESLNFCLEDGETLVAADPTSEAPTALNIPEIPSESQSAQQVRTTDATAVQPTERIPRAGPQNQKLFIIATVAAICAAAGVFVYRAYNVTNNAQITSIAVLPFENKGGDADTDYLSDGLADSIMYRLSQFPGLTVSPRSVVYRYKGNESDSTKIGKELGVDAILSGRIIERGDNLTVSVELVDVRKGKLLWGEQYDRKMSELLATQRVIAQEITEKLQIKVVGGDEKGIAKHYTESSEAYQLYLKGRFYWDKRTRDALNKAIGFFEQAIAIDPNFALAYTGLALSYVAPGIQVPPNDAMPKAKVAAKRALELDDSLPEAHTAMARVLAAYDWDWQGAEREYKRAIELNPRYPVAHQWYGGYFEAQGRRKEALAERKLALQIDPLSLVINFELAQALYYSHDYDRAIQQYEKTLELDGGFPPAWQFLPAAYEQKGNYAEAIAKFRGSPVLNQGGEFWPMAKAGLGHAYASNGQKQEALALVEELKRVSEQQYIPGASIALIYAGLGDKDQAVRWLEKAYDQHDFQMQWLDAEPRWDNLRSDPRFQDLIRKIGLSNSAR